MNLNWKENHCLCRTSSLCRGALWRRVASDRSSDGLDSSASVSLAWLWLAVSPQEELTVMNYAHRALCSAARRKDQDKETQEDVVCLWKNRALWICYLEESCLWYFSSKSEKKINSRRHWSRVIQSKYITVMISCLLYWWYYNTGTIKVYDYIGRQLSSFH